MSRRFEELAWRETPIGTLSLRRRVEPTLKVDVYEVKLGDEFLMSSLFTISETELARLALAELAGDELDVVVAGLGLGYTARAALENPRVATLTVVEALEDVIEWHERELLPGAAALVSDPRTRLVHGDFFELVGSGAGFDSRAPQRRHDAVIVDIDHTPRHVLHPTHASFYTQEGLGRLARYLRPGGVFALWSDDPPDPAFITTLRQVFTDARSHEVTFANFYTGGESAATIYTAR